MAPSTVGQLEHITPDAGEGVRLLVEVPLDNRHQRVCRDARLAGQAYPSLWSGQLVEGAMPLLPTLATAGIAPPPLLEVHNVHDLGCWHWGTVWVNPFSLYMFDVEDLFADGFFDGPVFALSHQGHGINSYGLNLVAGTGRLVAYVQHGYGGAYSDRIERLEAIAATYARCGFSSTASTTLEPQPRRLMDRPVATAVLRLPRCMRPRRPRSAKGRLDVGTGDDHLRRRARPVLGRRGTVSRQALRVRL